MKLAIVGASGHGRVVADIAEKTGYSDIVFLDDNPEIKNCGKWPVIGSSNKEYELDRDIFVAIGNAEIREKLTKRFCDRHMATLIHPSAVVADDVEIGAGSVVMAGAIINPGAKIGRSCIINTASSVDHDCILDDYVHISVGSHLCGTVEIGKSTWIGAGATVSNNISICGGCLIGAGATVVKSIKKTGTYLGVPAKMLVRDHTESLQP